jgi:hypothetical protein
VSCIKISHANLMPGWGCCQCKTYNSEQRQYCKNCTHICCFKEADTKADKSKLN